MTENILAIDPNETMLRLRTLVKDEETDFLITLTRAELTDMLFCACTLLNILQSVLPAGLLEQLFAQGVDFND